LKSGVSHYELKGLQRIRLLYTGKAAWDPYFRAHKKFPDHGKFLLTAQIVDSSRSVTRNIEEGYGRYSYTDTRNFFIMTRGPVTETMEHLTTAYDEKYNRRRKM